MGEKGNAYQSQHATLELAGVLSTEIPALKENYSY